MRQVRLFMALVALFLLVLVAPNPLLSRWSELWRALEASDHASDLSALGRLRSASPEDAQVVVLGSSMAAVNVSSWMLEREAGRTVLNAGVLGMPPVASAQYLPEVLALRPQTVVVVTGPTSLAWTELPESSPFDARIAWASYGAAGLVREDLLSAAAGRLSLGLRLRGVPRAWLTDSLHPDGAHPANMPRLAPARFRRVARTRHRELLDSPTVVDGPNSRALTALCDHLHRVGTELVLVAAPVHPLVFATDGQTFHPPHVAELQRVAEDCGARFLGPDQQPAYVDTDFRDPTHLDNPGQRKLTQALIEALR